MVSLIGRALLGGGERKAAEAEKAKAEAKKKDVKDWFQPDAPHDGHLQKDPLRAIFGDKSLAGKKNDLFSAKRPETDDRFSAKRPETTNRASTRSETDDRYSPTRERTDDRYSPTRERTDDRYSPTRERTDDRLSTRRRETNDRSDREKTTSRAPSTRNGDGGQDREVPGERAYDRNAPADGKPEGDGKPKPGESKKTLGQSMKDGSKGLLKDYVDYKATNAIPNVDNEVNAVTSKIGGAVEEMLGGGGGGGDGGGGGGMYPPSGMMRGDKASGDKNISKPSTDVGKAGRLEGIKPRAPETRPRVSQETREIWKDNLDRYLEKNKLPSANNRGNFTSELSQGSGRTFRRRMDEMNGVPIESVA